MPSRRRKSRLPAGSCEFRQLGCEVFILSHAIFIYSRVAYPAYCSGLRPFVNIRQIFVGSDAAEAGRPLAQAARRIHASPRSGLGAQPGSGPASPTSSSSVPRTQRYATQRSGSRNIAAHPADVITQRNDSFADRIEMGPTQHGLNVRRRALTAIKPLCHTKNDGIIVPICWFERPIGGIAAGGTHESGMTSRRFW